MRALQRYVVCDAIASGGMGAVHLSMLRAGGGFSRVVAIKVMHALYAKDEHFRAMFLDEARIVARVRDPHVVSTLDILEEDGELFLVMDYVHGPSLAKILKDLTAADEAMPLRVAVTVTMDLLDGLHAAHEAVSDAGERLNVVHRDVSPQNVLVGIDGLARVMDFGIATAADQLHLTQPGELKGKASYMAPEQALGETLDRRADVYAAGVVLFEVLTLRRPFVGGSFAEVTLKHLGEAPPRPSVFRSEVSPELDDVVLRALAKEPDARFASARAMREALDALGLRAPPHEVGEWLKGLEGEFFRDRDAALRAVRNATPAPTAGPEPGEPTEPTHLEATADERSSRASRPSRLGVVLAAAAGLGAIAFAGSRLSKRASEPPAIVLPAATPSLAPPPSDAPSASGAPLESAMSASAPSASASAHAQRTASTHARPHATAAPTTSAAPALPDCCAGNLRIRVSQCNDNCPAGT